MLRLGAYLLSEVNNKTDLGKRVRDYYLHRRRQNKARKKPAQANNKIS
jgi:hypothetical protein